jgi:hypothetical protein
VSPCEEADLDLGVPSRDWLSGRHSSETIKMLNDGPLDVRYGSQTDMDLPLNQVCFAPVSGHSIVVIPRRNRNSHSHQARILKRPLAPAAFAPPATADRPAVSPVARRAKGG